MSIKNRVQLITYPDSMGGDFSTLNQVLHRHFDGLFQGGIHLLPPFPSTGDRGYSPVSYFQIEPRFGSWQEIQELGGQYDLMLDLMVNHISSSSEYFKDFMEKGPSSKYADMFLEVEKFWPDGRIDPADLDRLFLRRKLPFSDFFVGPEQMKRTLWTTFGKGTPSDQVDVDVNSAAARELFSEIIRSFSQHGIKFVRLDAIGYVIKKLGTSCFFVEPEIYEFMDWIRDTAVEYGIELLPELHAEFETQRRLSAHGYWIYDFMLPYLILEGLVKKDSRKLKDYLRIRPEKQFTMLDCHDGIPVKPDLNGYYQKEEVREVVELCEKRGANMSRVISARHQDADGFDVHQIRGTYYSMLGADDDAYYAARAIQLFTPGIPQIYYVGLLAGENDVASMQRTGEGREINRHSYTVAEIEREVERPIVKRLMRLIKFRNDYPAFDGKCEIEPCGDQELAMTWIKEKARTRLSLDLKSDILNITYLDLTTGQTVNLH